MKYIGRTIQSNAPLRDGTPRREDGYRAFVETYGPEPHPALPGALLKKFHKSPLFQSHAKAAEWLPVGVK